MIWSEAERRAWSPPEAMAPSQWAERYRYLPSSMTAEPGMWRNERTPYLAGLMDAICEPGVEEVVFLKAVQVGFSEATRNLLGYWIDHEPGPALLVMPNEQSAKEIVEERIKPLLHETPALRRHVSPRSDDTKLTGIKLDTMSLYMAWAGSPQALASRPIRYLVFDEVDKYPPFAGREADPISLGLKRLTTYGHRARALIGSTPTTRSGNIWRRWELCGDQRHYHVPCPHCGAFQKLEFSRVHWPERGERERLAYADEIDQHDLAWYECAECGERLRDQHKPKMLARGVWAGSDQVVGRDGALRGPRTRAKRVGFHLSSLYSPWVRFSQLAAEFLRAATDPALLMDFRNARLAEPFEEQASATRPDVIAAKAAQAGPPLVVPDWAALLLATADVQKDRMYYVIRAWGAELRSQLVAHGMVTDFDELEKIIFRRPLAGPEGVQLAPQVLAIDAQYLTDAVHGFAVRDPARILPVHGGKPTAPPITERALRGYPGVIARTVNASYWKDVLHGLIHHEDASLWLPHAEIDADYVRQMTAEHKVLDPRQKLFLWVPVSDGAANHYWDCEYHQCWLARHFGAASVTPGQGVRQQVSQAKQAQRETHDRHRGEGGGGWATAHKGRW